MRTVLEDFVRFHTPQWPLLSSVDQGHMDLTFRDLTLLYVYSLLA